MSRRTGALARCVVLVAVATCGCDEAPQRPVDATWATMASPEARQAVVEGTIPHWIPDSAIDVREAHDPATGESVLAFSQPPDSTLILPSWCDPCEYADVAPARMTRPWWPSADAFATGYMFYRCPADEGEPRTFIAVRNGGPSTYVWEGRSDASR